MWVNQDLTLRSVTPECRVFYASYRLVDKEVELQNKLHRQLEQEKKLRRQAMAAAALARSGEDRFRPDWVHARFEETYRALAERRRG